MNIAISAESAIDFKKDLQERFNIYTTPFTILLGDQMVLDGEIKTDEIFEFVDKTKVLPKTSAVNEFQFSDHFEKLLQSNDAVIHFSMSSSMSCAYQNAVTASKKFDNVYVIDTKSLSGGIALLAIKAGIMAKNGKSPEYIVENIKKEVDKVQVSLIVNKLDYLRKGGRCSSLVCFGANLLQIHPQIILKNGKLIPAKKYRGNFDRCVAQYCEDTLKEFNNFDKSLAFIAYTTLSDTALTTAKESLRKAGFKEIIELQTGATISSHAGPSAMGVLYLCN